MKNFLTLCERSKRNKSLPLNLKPSCAYEFTPGAYPRLTLNGNVKIPILNIFQLSKNCIVIFVEYFLLFSFKYAGK